MSVVSELEPRVPIPARMDKEFKIIYVMTYSWESKEEIGTARSHTDFSKPGSHSVRQDPERYNRLRIKDQWVLLSLSFSSSSKGVGL